MTWISQQTIKPKLECTACGASCEAACTCGATYVPAAERAEKAIAANPGKSDRQIAAEIGVGKTTVVRARARAAAEKAEPAGGPLGPPAKTETAGGPDGPPEKRRGKDGKLYSVPARRKPAPKAIAAPTKADDFQSRVKQAIELAFYGDGSPTQEDIDAAHKASAIWRELAKKMEDENVTIEAPSASTDAPATAPDEPVVDLSETIVSEVHASDAEAIDNAPAALDLGDTSVVVEIDEAA